MSTPHGAPLLKACDSSVARRFMWSLLSGKRVTPSSGNTPNVHISNSRVKGEAEAFLRIEGKTSVEIVVEGIDVGHVKNALDVADDVPVDAIRRGW